MATKLLTSVTATGASSALSLSSADFTVQASGLVSSSTGAATIKVQVSNDGDNWIDLGTITLTLGTAVTTDGIAANAKWALVRAKVTAISGTGAAVTVTLGA